MNDVYRLDATARFPEYVGWVRFLASASTEPDPPRESHACEWN